MDFDQTQQGVYPIIFSQNPSIEKPELEIPARVQAAMGALTFLTNKTAKIIAGGGDIATPQEFDGQELQVEELELLRVAAKTITSYINGTLKYNKVEETAQRRYDTQVSSMENSVTNTSPTPSIRMECPSCHNNTMIKSKCQFCGGPGTVLVSRETRG